MKNNNFIIGTEFKCLPPCLSVLVNKIERANYLARIIKTCNQNNLWFADPGNHGWIKNSNNQFEIDFYSGPQFPEVIEKEVHNLNEASSDEESDISLSDESDYESSSDEMGNQSSDEN